MTTQTTAEQTLRQLKQNILFSYLGQAISFGLGFLLVPLYLHWLGTEAYGLIGFFTSLQLVFSILDLGLTATVSREIARRLVKGEKKEACGTAFTLQFVYAGIGFLIGLAFFAAGLGGGASWVNAHDIPRRTLENCFLLYGVFVFAKWPAAFYGSILRGLERHILFNSIMVANAVLRAAGIVLVLLFVSRSIEVFLLWQAFFAFVETVTTAYFAWSRMPREQGGLALDFSLIRKFWQFAAAMTALSFLVVLLRQMDKLFITRMLPLSLMGFYSAAAALSGLLTLFSTPLFYAIYPRMSVLVARKDETEIKSLYHTSTALVSALSAPAAGVLMFFPETILTVWTRSVVAASEASAALSFLAAGTLLNALMMSVPHALQLAGHRLKIPFVLNLIGIFIFVPGMYFGVRSAGPAGAGAVWAFFNLFYFFASSALTHRYFVHGSGLRWYFRDTLPYFAAGIGIPAVFRVCSGADTTVHGLVSVAAAFAAATFVCTFMYEPFRRHLNHAWRKLLAGLGR